MEVIKYTQVSEDQSASEEILKVNEILRTQCLKVTDIEAVKDLIANMKEIISVPGEPGLGLAAPQLGQNVSVLVMRTGIQSSGLTIDKPILTIINPEIIKVGKKTVIFREGCLSVPDKIAIVERPKEVKVKFMDETGRSQKMTFKGGDAVVFCHEYDHLCGILMIDRALQVQEIPKPVKPITIPPVETDGDVQESNDSVVITNDSVAEEVAAVTE